MAPRSGLSEQAAADLLGMNVKAVRRLVRDGVLRKRDGAGYRRIDLASVLEVMPAALSDTEGRQP